MQTSSVIGNIIGKHPLIEIGSTIEFITPDSPNGIINEGLIYTYPIDDVLKTMSRIFQLKILDTEEFNNIYYAIKNGFPIERNGYIGKYELNDDVIMFVVGIGEYNKDIIDRYMNKYGYFCSSEKEWDEEWIRYQYEKKFDTDVTDIVKNDVKLLYHLCPITLKEKILRQGLTPHESKYPGFSNDARLYFFLYNIGEMAFRLRARRFKKEKGQDVNGYLVLEIDTDKIRQDIKFYRDPRMDDAVYTMQGISPEAITIKYEFNEK